MKKFLSMALALTMALGVFTGCGSKEQTPAQKPDVEQGAASEGEESKGSMPAIAKEVAKVGCAWTTAPTSGRH